MQWWGCACSVDRTISWWRLSLSNLCLVKNHHHFCFWSQIAYGIAWGSLGRSHSHPLGLSTWNATLSTPRWGEPQPGAKRVCQFLPQRCRTAETPGLVGQREESSHHGPHCGAWNSLVVKCCGVAGLRVQHLRETSYENRKGLSMLKIHWCCNRRKTLPWDWQCHLLKGRCFKDYLFSCFLSLSAHTFM